MEIASTQSGWTATLEDRTVTFSSPTTPVARIHLGELPHTVLQMLENQERLHLENLRLKKRLRLLEQMMSPDSDSSSTPLPRKPLRKTDFNL